MHEICRLLGYLKWKMLRNVRSMMLFIHYSVQTVPVELALLSSRTHSTVQSALRQSSGASISTSRAIVGKIALIFINLHKNAYKYTKFAIPFPFTYSPFLRTGSFFHRHRRLLGVVVFFVYFFYKCKLAYETRSQNETERDA